MKKVFLTVLAVMLVAVPAVQAQKVNKSALVSKIEKSDADIADAKKGAKAATWINRGKAFYEAAIEPTKSLFVNMDAAMLKLAVGEPASTESVTLVNVPYEAWVYPWFTAYIKDGKIVWKVDGGAVYGRKTGNWGTSECPLVYDDKVIYTPAGDQTTMVALNKDTGELIWKTESFGDTGAYVSPILISYKGKRQIIGSTAKHVIGVNPDNGTVEWSFADWGPKEGKWANIAPNTPLYKDGKIFFCHGYNINGVMLQLSDDLKSVSVVWRTDVLDTHHGGYVEVNGTIYGSNWINNNQGNWCAIDWNTGAKGYETTWTGGKGKGSIIAADGMLYCYDERRGAVALVNPDPAKFDIVSEFRITKGVGPHWAHPVIVNGVLYIRHGFALMAYKMK